MNSLVNTVVSSFSSSNDEKLFQALADLDKLFYSSTRTLRDLSTAFTQISQHYATLKALFEEHYPKDQEHTTKPNLSPKMQNLASILVQLSFIFIFLESCRTHQGSITSARVPLFPTLSRFFSSRQMGLSLYSSPLSRNPF